MSAALFYLTLNNDIKFMPYLYADGKNTIECADCKQVKNWYSFPFKYNKAVCFRCIQGRQILKIKRLMNRADEHNLQTLREKLFDAIDMVKSKEMSIPEAKSICEIAQTIINSAKVEIEYLKAIGSKKGGKFLELQPMQEEV